ncbi:G-type lectin S-receptor-like serine/threonine-protein kinase At2g19130 [Lactuca sativa]|uniref:Bulb-type lectin domain-containing protein n=1 Tax=Lactuca sativa TaxID=4236 RepID=A0A9R1WBC3_LACSA|nr:G-type lectin S-receptor-like serine/threonine-protein kinase At2g19130 [Lactuca sativa]KAJ0219278.1 hypothetical protein LSAT_V11C300118400 [Lactuca sativa]
MCFFKEISIERFVVLLYFTLSITISSGADTIFANQSLSGDHTIISKGGQFELGFFKAGDSSNYYIGIWYYKKLYSNPSIIVWVANRETSISDRFRSELKIIDGSLVLLNDSMSQIWLTNVTFTTTILNSATTLIHDDGNLVLRDSGSNSVEPFWQSFENPTHTWLPGAKLGYTNITKKRQFLTSQRTNEDPIASYILLTFEDGYQHSKPKWVYDFHDDEDCWCLSAYRIFLYSY